MDTALDVVEFLKPKPCPVPLVRIGGNRDGAYLVPDDLAGVSACFSPGVSNRKGFEDDLQDRYGIGAHMCDFTSEEDKFATPLRSGQSFRKLWLGTETEGDTITLQDWVSEQAPDDSDLLLQMDIEGAEYPTLNTAPDDVLRRFRVVLVELHGLVRLNKPHRLELVLPFFEKLSRHFTCVHIHPNNVREQIRIGKTNYWVPRILEVTLLRKDRFDAAGELIPPQLPHPLDIPFNVRWKQPQAMGKIWLS